MRYVASILAVIVLVLVVPVHAETENVAPQQNFLAADDLFANPAYAQFALSPDGRFISFYQLDRGDGKQIVVLARDTLETEHLINVSKDMVVESYQWLDATTLLIAIEEDGSSYSAFVSIGIDGDLEIGRLGNNARVFARLADGSGQVLYRRTRDDDEIHYELWQISPDDLIKQNFDNAQRLVSAKQKFIGFAYDKASDRILGIRLVDDELIEIMYSDRAQIQWQTAMSKRGLDEFIVPVAFVGPNKLAVITDQDTDKRALRTFDIVKQELDDEVLFEHPEYDLVDVEYSSNNELEYVSYYQHGLLTRHYFSSSAARRGDTLQQFFPRKNVFIASESDDEQYRLLHVRAANESGIVYVWDGRSEAAPQLVRRRYPEHENLEFANAETLVVETADGTSLEAYFYQPQSDFAHDTLLVWPHGGPVGVRDDIDFNADVQYLTSRGFAVVQVNFRGSSGFGKNFREQGVGQFGQQIEADISAVVTHIQEQYNFSKLCSLGESYGGYSAVMLAIKNPELYQCVSAGFGVYDLSLLFNESNTRTRDEYRDWIAAVVGDYDTSLQNSSPVYFAERLKAPLLLYAGEEDLIAPIEHSNRLYYQLDRLQHDVEFYSYKRAKHGHPRWTGDRHEAALKADFLYQSLSLPYPAKSSLSESERAAIAGDLINLIRGLNTESFISVAGEIEDIKRYFLQRATQYDDPEALYLLALHRLAHDDADGFPLAVEELVRASAEEYVYAAYRLAEFYLYGEYVAADAELAQHYLNRARELGEGNERVESNVELLQGMLYCTAKDPELRDEEACLQILEMRLLAERFGRSHSSILKNFLAYLFMSEQTSTKIKQRIIREYIELAEFNETPIGFSELRAGLLVANRSKDAVRNEMLVVQSSQVIDTSSLADDQDYFIGLNFIADYPGIDRNRDLGAIFARITIYDAASEQVIDVSHSLMYAYGNDFWRIAKRDWEPGQKWRFELVNHNGVLLYDETFTLVE